MTPLDESKNHKPPQSRRDLTQRVVLASLIFLCGIFLAVCCGFAAPLEFAITTVLGWCSFLVRVLPEMTVNWSGLFTAAFCGFLFIVLLHHIAKWLFRNIGEPSVKSRRVWRMRWTLTSAAVLVLLFVAGIASVGVTHQTGWLASSPEPIMSRQSRIGRNDAANCMRQITYSIYGHVSIRRTLPAGGTFTPVGQQLHSWQTFLLPFVEEDNVFKRINLQKPWYDPCNKPAMHTTIRFYLDSRLRESETVDGYALSHLTANSHVMNGGKPMTLDEFTDGTENTILIGAAAGNYKPWGHALNWRDPSLGFNTTPDGFGGPDDNAHIIGMADGSVRRVSGDISPSVLRAISTPNGGEKVDSDW